MSEKANEGNGFERLRVLVCDDHALFRRGLEMVLGQEEDLELVGEASDGVEVVAKAQELMPDVILMDVRMPKKSGIEAAGEIKDMLPHVKILMLTISDEEADLYEAIKAGASGYLLKEIPIEEVADAKDVESALDVIVEKLERQIRDHHEKKRTKLIAGASRVKSANNHEQTPVEE